MMKGRRWLLLILVLGVVFVAGPARGQGVPVSGWPTPNPSASIGSGVLLGNVGGTLGVGGSTVKIPVTSLAAPLAAPIAQLITPNELAAPTTNAQGTFPSPTGSATGYTLPGITTLGKPLSPANGGIGPLLGLTGITKVVCFGDSWCSNGGNGAFNVTTPQYCSTFNVQNNFPNSSGCFADQVAAYYGVPLLNLGQPGTCAGSYGVSYYCASGANGFSRYASQLIPQIGPGTLVLFEYAGVNEISQADVGFASAGGIATFQSDIYTMVSAAQATGATVVMMDTPHQTLPAGTILKLQQIQQASAAVQTDAAQLGVPMARAFEVLGSCWYDAVLGPGVSYCSQADGFHASNGSTTIYGNITSTGSQTIPVFSTPTGPLYPVSSTVVIDPGQANQETVTLTGTGTNTLVGGTITANFTKTHTSGAYVFGTQPIANLGNTLLAQAFEQASFTSSVSNGANPTVGTNQALPVYSNYLTNIGCLQVIASGATPLGCSQPAVAIQTSSTTGVVYFGGPGTLGTNYGSLAFNGSASLPLFAFSAGVQAAGVTATDRITVNTTSNYIPIQISTTSSTGVGISMANTGGTAQQTEMLSNIAAGTINGIAATVFGIQDVTGSAYDLAIDSSGDVSARGKLVAINGVYPHSSTGAGWTVGAGVPSGGCTTSTAGSIYTNASSATLTTELYVCVNVSGTASWNAVTIP